MDNNKYQQTQQDGQNQMQPRLSDNNEDESGKLSLQQQSSENKEKNQKLSLNSKAENSQPIQFKEDEIDELKGFLNKKKIVKIKHKSMSIYDFIKIRVYLDNENYYVLSRFFISRILNLCKIMSNDSLQIARELKKKLVANKQYCVTKKEMEDALFSIIKDNFYEEENINKYKMMSLFYQKRVPLILLISGAPLVEKSFIATCLAERMNISNILQTNIVELVMKNMGISQFQKKVRKQNFVDYLNQEQMIEDLEKYCQFIRLGVNTDISKCFNEGKSVIIEGFGIDLSMYVNLKQQNQQSEDYVLEFENQKYQKLELLNQYINNQLIYENNYDNLQKINKSGHIQNQYEVIFPVNNESNEIKDHDYQIILQKQKEFLQIDQRGAIIVPLLLVMNKRDHKNLLQKQLIKQHEHFSYDQISELSEKMLNTYQHIQDHLINKQYNISTIIPVNINDYESTLYTIQNVVLSKIEEAYLRKDF